jgi:hypothetical protein
MPTATLRLVRRVALPAVILVFLTAGASGSAAATPVWALRSVALPTNFAAADNQPCTAEEADCNQYTITAVNVGTAPSTTEPTVINDALPPDVVVKGVSEALATNPGEAGGNPLACTNSATTVRCEYTEPVRPGSILVVSVVVTVEPGVGATVTNAAQIEGGGATSAQTAPPTTVSNTVDGAAPAFGLQDFGVGVYDADGGFDAQAGSHPGAIVTTIAYNSETTHDSEKFHAVAEPKTTIVDLPLGFVGDPLAAGKCPESTLRGAHFVSPCPADSKVGTVTIDREGGELVEPIYNVTPEPGYPAEFGFEFDGTIVLLRARVLPSRRGYMLSVTVPDIPRSSQVRVTGISIMFFGNPAEQDEVTDTPSAFATNPGDCGTGPLTAEVQMNSWVDPGAWTAPVGATMYESSQSKGVGGCEALLFEPKVDVTPETSQVDTPSGYEIALTVPQASNLFPVDATPDLKNAELTLPVGVSVSPGAADGLVGCQERGPEGIELGDADNPNSEEVEEGEELGPDGLLRASAGHCPQRSQIGEVEVDTPILEAPLHGHVFLAQPRCGGGGQPACTEASAASGELFGVYLEAAGSGVVIKLRGTVRVDPNTGRIATTVEDAPQFPFKDVKLNFNNGPRAPLSNPQTCGDTTTTSTLAPWSGTSAATPSSSFALTGCSASQPFAPGFLAQTTLPTAGAFSAFAFTLSRQDGEQDLSSVQVRMPPGLLGMLSQVQQCPEPQASNGTCGPESLIGHTSVAAGAGSHPFWERGNVFLTSSYKGGPFGLSIVTPAIAGPFNLGDIIVRAAINVDPHTAAVTVTSDPIPRIIDGVPLRIQTINVMVDRPGFIFNPTDCAQQQVAGAVAGALPDGTPGASVQVSTPFAVTGCKNLPFKPTLTATTQGNSTKAHGASLVVKVTSAQGQANIAKTALILPIALPSRLSTIQKACVASVFEANPAACDAGANVGTATVHTPVLKSPLTGPAYLVSHGGAKFPDIEFVLQGEGVALVLDGQTDIKHGITSTTFESVPDAPVTTFEAKLPEGPHSALAANVAVAKRFSLCGARLVMPTTITGQNGAVVRQQTKIAISGCKATQTTGSKTLAAALKACKKKRSKSKRRSCDAGARKRFKRGNARKTLKKH